jgi:hypothetical protein
VRLHQPAVGRNGVTGFKHDHVARHEVARDDVSPIAGAQHSAGPRHHSLQGLRRALCRVLLSETDESVQHDHGEDRHGKLECPELARRLQQVRQVGDAGRDQEDHREQISELAE